MFASTGMVFLNLKNTLNLGNIKPSNKRKRRQGHGLTRERLGIQSGGVFVQEGFKGNQLGKPGKRRLRKEPQVRNDNRKRDIRDADVQREVQTNIFFNFSWSFLGPPKTFNIWRNFDYILLIILS